jgi:predicted nucleotide-binding protein
VITQTVFSKFSNETENTTHVARERGEEQIKTAASDENVCFELTLLMNRWQREIIASVLRERENIVME